MQGRHRVLRYPGRWRWQGKDHLPPVSRLADQAVAGFPFPDHTRHDIVTGNPAEGTVNVGGLSKRLCPGTILVFLDVADIDAILAKAENPGGKSALPKGGAEGVGLFAVITDKGGNLPGLHRRPG